MKLHTLKPAEGSVRTNKRLGRGQGSGGSTAGRGHKGAQSRSGYSKKSGFEGGQMPLQRRIPKFGFKNDKVKVLGRGELKTKVNVEAHKFSATATQAIEKVGGTATTVK